MPEAPFTVDSILEIESLASLDPATAIDLLGTWVDVADSERRDDVLRHLAQLASTIRLQDAHEIDRADLDYYLANLWGSLKYLAGPYPSGGWEWEQEETEKQTIHLRRALRSPEFPRLDTIRRSQILTNLGNCYSTTGRFIEAISAWNDALALEPRFGMARGNRAVSLWSYAHSVYDPGHSFVVARDAWRGLDPATLEGLETGAGPYFERVRRGIEAAFPLEALRSRVDIEQGFPLGETEEEIRYRRWCLDHGLFLNPINDLGPYTIASQDVLTSPSIVVPLGGGPQFHGFFNQIKQEYCSARWLVYEAIHAAHSHFSDRDVLLYDTLDSPIYSLATEKLRLAFRTLYSLFDKITFFLNAYLQLGIAEHKVSFRGLWYIKQQRTKGIRPEFEAKENWPLRGLYWLGKDLYEDAPDFRATIDPDAQRLNEIRNHLEHKYLKIHDHLWRSPVAAGEQLHFVDDLAESMRYDDFVRMTMRLASLVRAALIYLSLGVHREEQSRAAARPAGTITPPITLEAWEHVWRKQDPGMLDP